jgi:hypothetical protein
MAGDGTSTARVTRRQLLSGDPPPPPSDAVLIAMMLQIEQLAVAVYERAIASGRLLRPSISLAREVLAHERLHASALRRELRRLRGHELREPRTVKQLQAALSTHHTKVDFSVDRADRDWLKLLSDVEDVLERNYHLTISELRRASLLTLCAEILASEAQHSALLGELLSPHNVEDAVPNAFINGN